MSNASKTGLFRTNLDYNDSPANYPFGMFSNSVGTIDQPGVIRDDMDANFGTRYFRFALLDSNTSANVISGDLVNYLSSALAGAPGNVIANAVVTTSIANSAGNDAVAGVAIGNITKGNYGWFQFQGYHPGVNSNSNAVVNNLLISSGTDKKVSPIAGGNNVSQMLVGTALANTASSLTPARLTMSP